MGRERYKATRWWAVVVLAGVGSWQSTGCGGLVTWDPKERGTAGPGEPGEPEPVETCDPGEARWCSDATGCRGVQHCRSLGVWSPCFCQSEQTPEQCSADDPVRRCTNACGAGLQRCVDGIWQPCTGYAERDCDNGCASGMEYCVGDEWLPCDAPTAQPCSNGCADGTEICIDGTWTDCNAPFERACSNTCGSGTELCVDAAWTPCDARAVAECSTFCGPGERVCRDGAWGPCSAHDPVWPVFEATVRDFQESHPDMERPGWGAYLPGLVLPDLGEDGKPVYSGIVYSRIEGRETFDQWYRDVPGVNLTTTVEIPLEPVAGQQGTFRFSDPYFFPIDGQLFGNEGNVYNFHFTLELVTRFRYFGSEVFSFSGDDDLWVFINERLAIDLGGEHEELSASVYLDASAAELGIVPDNEYPLHLFFAERHTLESHFTIETTIKDWDACP